MPLPKRLARFNRSVTNRLTRPAARHLPGFGVVLHQGRRSRANYETPVNCWFSEDSITIALTYGKDVDWLKNLEANAGGQIVVRGRVHKIGPPRVLSTDEGMRRMSLLPSWILPKLKVTEFRELPVLASSGSNS